MRTPQQVATLAQEAASLADSKAVAEQQIAWDNGTSDTKARILREVAFQLQVIANTIQEKADKDDPEGSGNTLEVRFQQATTRRNWADEVYNEFLGSVHEGNEQEERGVAEAYNRYEMACEVRDLLEEQLENRDLARREEAWEAAKVAFLSGDLEILKKAQTELAKVL